MGIEPTEHASQHVPPVLKTGPVTRSGRATVAESNSFLRSAEKKIGSAPSVPVGSPIPTCPGASCGAGRYRPIKMPGFEPHAAQSASEPNAA